MTGRVLFTCWPFEGHVHPLLSLALAVRENGGEVAFYTGERARAAVNSQGIELFPFDRVEGVWNRVHEREQLMQARGRSLRVERVAFRSWLLESIPDQVADLRAVLNRWRPDVIVTDGSMWAPSLVLRETSGLPVVFASTLIFALIPGPDAPPPGGRIPAAPHSARARAATWALGGAIDLLARGGRRRIDELRAGYGLAPLGCSVNEYMSRLDLYLVGSVPELDLCRNDLPLSVHYVGPLVWHPPQSKETAAWLDRIPGDGPWVHVTEGTSHHEDPFLLSAAAQGLAGGPYQAILTTGRDRDPASLGLAASAGNVHVTRWLSHSDLIPRCSVVVTTGGAQTIIAALGQGVPLVIVPTGWDKPANAARVVHAGAAVRITPRRCTPERLRAAVELVLTEHRFHERAAALAARLEAAPGPAGAANLIEALLPRRAAVTQGGLR